MENPCLNLPAVITKGISEKNLSHGVCVHGDTPSHNLGHRSSVHRSRDPVACVPGPCHCPWGHDRVQGLPAKCSSRELPGGGPGQGASAFMDQRWFSSAQDFPSGIAHFAVGLVCASHPRSCVLSLRARPPSLWPICCCPSSPSCLTFPFLQLLPLLQPSQLSSLGIRLFKKIFLKSKSLICVCSLNKLIK